MWAPIPLFQFKNNGTLMPDLFQIVVFYFQPGKSLYTTVRELVENALDSSESISELPEVEVTMYVPFLSFTYQDM